MSSSLAPDHYATLGVDQSAPHAAIRTAYRRVMRTVHPDVARDDPTATAQALAANTAWAVLRDPAQRALYDRQRAGGDPPAERAATGHVVPSWAVGGVRPVTAQQLREAAARESAYSALGRQQRLAFSAA
ncbi:MAG TPA: J domain-containing protein, partial [Euzebya sp.]|nr:J domain-containing protein [Euzebya sp.]